MKLSLCSLYDPEIPFEGFSQKTSKHKNTNNVCPQKHWNSQYSIADLLIKKSFL